MYRRFRSWSRVGLTLTLASLITFNPALAGRDLRGWLNHRFSATPCCEVVACGPVVPTCCLPPSPSPCCSSPIVPVDPCCTYAVGTEPVLATPVYSEGSSCCGDFIAPSGVSPSLSGDSHHSSPTTPSGVAPSEPALSTEEAPPQLDESPSDASQAVPTPFAVPESTDASPLPDSVDPESDSLLEEDPDVSELQSEEPEPWIDDEPPAADEVFPETQPVDEPAPLDDDLFGDSEPTIPETPEVPEPSDDSFDAPSSESSDDLFGDSEPPATETPDNFFDDAPPAELDAFEPNTDLPSDDLFDDLDVPAEPRTGGDDFFDAPSEPSAPLDDDLFGSSSPEAESAASTSSLPEAADDLFQSPEIPSVDSDDDLFGPASSEGDAFEAEPSNVEDDDLFSDNAIRTWRDNTGTFQVDASLAEIHPEFVRLLKSNGNHCKVPLRRLSNEDRQLVELIASLGKLEKGKMVSTENRD